MSLDLQFLLGLLLYVRVQPDYRGAFHDFGAAMKDKSGQVLGGRACLRHDCGHRACPHRPLARAQDRLRSGSGHKLAAIFFTLALLGSWPRFRGRACPTGGRCCDGRCQAERPRDLEHALALSFVIPLYNSADTIAALVRDIEALTVEGGHEIVLVNDGSGDATSEVCRELVARRARVPITLVEHARNFGEHNAVLTGWRHARGAYIVNLDDDGQNPPAEAVRLWQHARGDGLDVVFGHYEVQAALGVAQPRQLVHEPDDRLGARQAARASTCRASAASARSSRSRSSSYAGPYPYIDGLLLQVTQRIGSIEVRHDAAPGRAEHLHAPAADPALAERLGQFLAPAAAGRDVARRCALAVAGLVGVRRRRLAVAAAIRARRTGWGWIMAALLSFPARSSCCSASSANTSDGCS